MDFATLPPEVNSGLMYAGPGSGPVIAAAASWNSLATEVSSAAVDYGSVISGLTSGPWRGPASALMAAAAAPYVSWMNATAAQAEQAANQAKAAASAYETAFTATVPPPVIVANRTLLASLISTNILGQNTPAIAATEAHYAEMWAQDAGAMYGYAGSAAAATTLAPFAQPPETTTTTGAAAQAATVGQATGTGTQATLSQLVSTVPAALQELASPVSSTSSTSGLNGIMSWLGLGGTNLTTPAGILSFLSGADGSPLGALLNDNGLNTLFSSGFYMPGNFLGTMSDFVGLGGAGAASEAAGDAAAGAAAAAGGIGSAVAAPAAGLGELGGLGGGVSAAMGRGAAIGALAVPPGWNPGVVATSPLPAVLGGTPLAPSPAVAAGVPGMPFATAAGNHADGSTPHYGFRPTVMAHSPAAG
ncbi:MAG TPA: PPE family protein [Mycobacterium sp.]|jgi:PPE-repeat protein|uniref:PPE family protein n=1 Tax=Mycobacterium sp. TaxID=1785 RepID=UPI002F3F8061